MTGSRFAVAFRNSGLLRLLVLFGASFAMTFAWQAHAPSLTAAPVSHATREPEAMPASNRVFQTVDRQMQSSVQIAKTVELLPADHLANLVETGISAEDSEQRSLAIVELAQGPVQQSLGGLATILRDNRDTRSRVTALDALMQLPDSPETRAERQRLLDVLVHDPDARFAAAVRAAADGWSMSESP